MARTADDLSVSSTSDGAGGADGFADLTTGSLLGADVACFQADESMDVAGLIDDLTGEMTRLADSARDDPFRNPVLMLARHLSHGLEDGTLSYAALEQALQFLTLRGFVGRAARVGRYLGECNPGANDAAVRRLVGMLTEAKSGGTVGFDTFRQRVERESFGIVTTAHPTFNLTGELMSTLADLATGRDGSGVPLTADGRADRLRLAMRREHRPEVMTLEREHEMSLTAIANIHRALRRVYDAVFEIAEAHYPDRWTEIVPRVVSVATWVGYDLDGRSDIDWTDTLHKRLADQEMRLAHMLTDLAKIRAAAEQAAGSDALIDALDGLEGRLGAARKEAHSEIEAFAATSAVKGHDRDSIARTSRRMADASSDRLTTSAEVEEALVDAAKKAGSTALRRRLLILRAEVANYGLGMARVHVRINASQLHNAVRQPVGLEGSPDDPRYRVSYVARISEMLDTVQPATINFGSLLDEHASARRLFMVIAQVRKYVDRTGPVRFLIAECETAFTVLTALYFARLFGVEECIDISPLFETQRALEVGSRVVDQLLENPHYRGYIERRGRICVQTGFSDAGRYLGQIAAAASIERFRIRLADVLARHGLSGIDIVVFDTHGESIGRGAHPGGFADRLAYTNPPASRRRFDRAGVNLIEEVSFQGGDGFLYYFNESGAYAAVTRILEHALTPPPVINDPFYEDPDYIREAFTEITQFQVGLMRDPDYGALLSAIMTYLLYPSGSRPTIREHEGLDYKPIAFAAELRAIPHNATLLQLGVAANVLGGVGAAINRDPERFEAMYSRSPRLRSLMGMAEYALHLGDFDTMRAYVATLDPGLWLARAEETPDRTRAARMRDVADLLERANLHDRQDRVVRRLYRDYLDLRDGVSDVADLGTRFGDDALRTSLALVHAIRIALIHEIFMLAGNIPDFAAQYGTTRERVMMQLLRLDVPGAVAVLEKIFPADDAGQREVEDFGEPASYRTDVDHSYAGEHASLLRPLRGLHALCCRASEAVVHHIGFFG